MLNTLAKLREGTLSNRNFMYEKRYERILRLKVAKHISFAEVETTGVISLDIERVEDRYMLCGGKNGALVIYDLENLSGKLPFKCEIVAHTSPQGRFPINAIVKVQWFPFDSGIFTTSNRCTSVKVWDANKLAVETEISFSEHISSHDLSSSAGQHNLIAVATTSPVIRLADIKAGFCVQELRGHQSSALSVAWSPKSENVIAAGAVDGKILLWDIRSARGVLKSLNQHDKMVKNLFKILPSAHDYPVTSLKFTTDGLYLVSQGTDYNIRLWDADSFNNIIVNYAIQRRKNPTQGSSGFPYKTFEVCCDTSQPLLFVPTKLDMQVFDLHTGTEHETVLGHFQKVHCISYRSSTQELYSGGNDLDLLAWSPKGGKEVEREYLSHSDGPSQDVFLDLSDLDEDFD